MFNDRGVSIEQIFHSTGNQIFLIQIIVTNVNS